jgi:hypothetical protein
MVLIVDGDRDHEISLCDELGPALMGSLGKDDPKEGPRIPVRGNCRRESAGQSFRYAPLVSNSHDQGARYAARLPRIGLIIITAQEGRA